MTGGSWGCSALLLSLGALVGLVISCLDELFLFDVEPDDEPLVALISPARSSVIYGQINVTASFFFGWTYWYGRDGAEINNVFRLPWLRLSEQSRGEKGESVIVDFLFLSPCSFLPPPVSPYLSPPHDRLSSIQSCNTYFTWIASLALNRYFVTSISDVCKGAVMLCLV